MPTEFSKRITQLQDVAAAAATGNLNQVYSKSMQAIKTIIDAEVASLQLLDSESGGLRFVATLIPDELARLQEFDPIPLDEDSISGLVVTQGEPRFYSDSWQDPVFGARQRKVAEEKNVGNRSFICVPLSARGKVLGVLSVLHKDPHRFSEADNDLVISLSSFIAMAVDHAQFEERVKDIALAVSSLSLDQVYTASMKTLSALLDAEVASLQLLDSESGGLRFVATLIPDELARLQEFDPIPLDEDSISGLVVTQGEPRFYSDSWQDPVFGARQRKVAEEKNVGNRSFICVPLSARGKVLGVLSVLHKDPHRFMEADFRMVIIVASFLAIAIQNARQVDELLETRRRQANIERSIKMADVVNNFTHRIHNDLGYVQATVKRISKLLSNDNLEDEYLQNKLDAIQKAVSDTLELAAGFKDFDRINRKGEFVNLKDCVHQALMALNLKYKGLEDKIVLRFDRNHQVYATQQLSDVFENLLRNSADAIQGVEKQQIIIETQEVPNSRFLIVRVIDTGPGIPLDFVHSKLFQLGQSTKKSGMGFGLWWVRTWLERYGGSIQYKSSTEHGACFELELPLAPNPFT